MMDPTSTLARSTERGGALHASATDRVTALLVAAHVLAWTAVVVWMPPASLYGDIGRFVEIANHPGLPYRDFPVEFPPLQTVVIEALLRTELLNAAVRVALLSIACDLAIAWVLAYGWSKRVALRYLAMSLPLQLFMPFRLDYLPTLLAVVSAAVLRRGWHRLGGATLALATSLKLWPSVLSVALFRTRRAVPAFLTVGAFGVVVWWLIGGIDGFVQVATFRGSHGWHVESSVGAALWIFTDDAPFTQGGALRIGVLSSPLLAVLGVTYLALAVATAMRARRIDADPAGFPSVVLVAGLIAVSPLASPQYLAWLVPWCAIALPTRSGRIMDVLLLTAGTLASASFLVYWRLLGDIEDLRVPSILRAACVIAIAAFASAQVFSRARDLTTP